jgi:hypothetical protein
MLFDGGPPRVYVSLRFEFATLTRLPPEYERDRQGIDASFVPPRRFIADPMELAMVQAADRNSELVADLAAECARLRIT